MSIKLLLHLMKIFQHHRTLHTQSSLTEASHRVKLVIAPQRMQFWKLRRPNMNINIKHVSILFLLTIWIVVGGISSSSTYEGFKEDVTVKFFITKNKITSKIFFIRPILILYLPISSDFQACPCTNDTILTHLFPMHPFSTLWKHQKTLRFSDAFKGQRKGALGTNGPIFLFWMTYCRRTTRKE